MRAVLEALVELAPALRDLRLDDPGAVAQRLLVEARDVLALDVDRAESSGRLDRGDRGLAALLAVKADQRPDIDVGQADAFVITGSYNFSWSAQARNAENLLILRGNPALVRRYLENWQRHRGEAEKMSGAR